MDAYAVTPVIAYRVGIPRMDDVVIQTIVPVPEEEVIIVMGIPFVDVTMVLIYDLLRLGGSESLDITVVFADLDGASRISDKFGFVGAAAFSVALK